MSRRRNPRLKKSGTISEYTREQTKELMKCAVNPKHFINNYIYIKHAVKGQILFKMYDFQEDMVDLFQQNRYSLILASRQVGKTETSAAYLLWFALFHEDKTILILSNKADGAKEIIGKIQNAYEELPEWLKPGIDEDSWNKHECKFDNKSRIIAGTTSEDSARGLSISLLFLDEFAFVKNHIQQKFWTSASPTLSTGGSCIIASTPNGNSNLYAQMYRGAVNKTNDFAFLHVPWDAPPGRDEEFKQQQIGLLGKRKWLQEYECCHGNTLVELANEDETLFVKIPIEKAYEALYKGIDVFNMEPPELTGKYVISPLDSQRYCRSNGQFLRHILSYGYESYQDFFESLYPKHVNYCRCGEKASFKNASMSYYAGCGNVSCRNKNISNRKKEFSASDWNKVAEKYRDTMAKKTPKEIKDMIETRTKNGYLNNSYKNSVVKRRKTCAKRYGDETYNNAAKASDTKKGWSEERKLEFLKNLKESLGGKWLNDYMDDQTYANRRKTLEDKGVVAPKEDLTGWQLYRNDARNLTAKNYRKYKKTINPMNLPRGRGEGKYHLDHIIPVLYGFLNDIPVEQIASVDNLQMLTDEENRKKSYKYNDEILRG